VGLGFVTTKISSLDLNKTENTIKKLFWNGSSRNFTFEHFTAKLNGAYTDLETTGDVRTEEHRVGALLGKCSGDKDLRQYISIIRANTAQDSPLKSWTKAVQTLTNGVNHNQSQTSGSRNISTFATRGRGRGSGRYNGRGHSARGNSRHGGRGRGGRHNNRGNSGSSRGNSGSSRGNTVSLYPDTMSQDGQTILNGGTYSAQRWHTFTREDQNIVHEQRDRRDQELAREHSRGVAALQWQQPHSQEQPPTEQLPQGDIGSTMIRRRHGAS